MYRMTGSSGKTNRFAMLERYRSRILRSETAPLHWHVEDRRLKKWGPMKMVENNKNGAGRHLFDAVTFSDIEGSDERSTTGLSVLSPAERTVAEYWHNTFVKSERMWGPKPSQTATSLIALINEEANSFEKRILIADLGCGYGRDAVEFAKAGFDVLAIDIARYGLLLAKQDYEKMPLPGRIRFLHGTIRTLPTAGIGELDGISCHRTLHLMNTESVLKFARCAAELVRSGGFISIGARSPKDFDPETMDWVDGREGQTARYRDPSRNGHLITFLDQPLLDYCFGQYFRLRFCEGLEQERADNAAATKLIYMRGTRR
jgi:SAM-dependent methyltransferase